MINDTTVWLKLSMPLGSCKFPEVEQDKAKYRTSEIRLLVTLELKLNRITADDAALCLTRVQQYFC